MGPPLPRTVRPIRRSCEELSWPVNSRNATRAAASDQKLPPAARTTRYRDLLLVRLVLLLLVAFDELAPGLRADGALGLPDNVELAVLLHFADEHGLPQMVVLFVHLDFEAVGRIELLPRHRRAHLFRFRRLGLGDGLRPHVHAD